MVNALRAYKDGTRDDDTMTPRVKKLDDVAMMSYRPITPDWIPSRSISRGRSVPTSGPRNATAVTA